MLARGLPGPGTSHESGWRDSNPRPLRPERSALPSCATPRLKPRQRIAPPLPHPKRQVGVSVPSTGALEFDQRPRGAAGIDALGRYPIIAEIGVGVAVTAV